MAEESVVAKPEKCVEPEPKPWAKSSQHRTMLAWGNEFAGSSAGLLSLGLGWFRIYYCLLSCSGRSWPPSLPSAEGGLISSKRPSGLPRDRAPPYVWVSVHLVFITQDRLFLGRT